MVDETRTAAQRLTAAQQAMYLGDLASCEQQLTDVWDAWNARTVKLDMLEASVLRRLLAAVWRASDEPASFRRAVGILDQGIEATKDHPAFQVAYWLDLGRTFAQRGDEDATRCFEMTVKPLRADPKLADSKLVRRWIARADLEHARARAAQLGGDDKHVRGMIGSAREGAAYLHGEEHAFTAGAGVLGHVLGIDGVGEYYREKAVERIEAFAAEDHLVTEARMALDVALAALKSRQLANAEEFLRQALQAHRMLGTGTRRSLVHALTMTLYAAGKFELADVAVNLDPAPASLRSRSNRALAPRP